MRDAAWVRKSPIGGPGAMTQDRPSGGQVKETDDLNIGRRSQYQDLIMIKNKGVTQMWRSSNQS